MDYYIFRTDFPDGSPEVRQPEDCLAAVHPVLEISDWICGAREPGQLELGLLELLQAPDHVTASVGTDVVLFSLLLDTGEIIRVEPAGGVAHAGWQEGAAIGIELLDSGGSVTTKDIASLPRVFEGP